MQVGRSRTSLDPHNSHHSRNPSRQEDSVANNDTHNRTEYCMTLQGLHTTLRHCTVYGTIAKIWTQCAKSTKGRKDNANIVWENDLRHVIAAQGFEIELSTQGNGMPTSSFVVITAKCSTLGDCCGHGIQFRPALKHSRTQEIQ